MTIRRSTHALAIAVTLAAASLMACSTPATRGAGKEEQDRTASQAISDAAITARIKTTYIFNPHLNPFRIDVDTHDGVVTLNGTVKSGIQKDLRRRDREERRRRAVGPQRPAGEEGG